MRKNDTAALLYEDDIKVQTVKVNDAQENQDRYFAWNIIFVCKAVMVWAMAKKGRWGSES